VRESEIELRISNNNNNKNHSFTPILTSTLTHHGLVSRHLRQSFSSFKSLSLYNSFHGLFSHHLSPHPPLLLWSLTVSSHNLSWPPSLSLSISTRVPISVSVPVPVSRTVSRTVSVSVSVSLGLSLSFITVCCEPMSKCPSFRCKSEQRMCHRCYQQALTP